MPPGFAPFGIQNLNGMLFVTYAKTQPGSDDERAGALVPPPVMKLWKDKKSGVVTTYDYDETSAWPALTAMFQLRVPTGRSSRIKSSPFGIMRGAESLSM